MKSVWVICLTSSCVRVSDISELEVYTKNVGKTWENGDFMGFIADL